MPLSQRIAHVAPKGALGIRDLDGHLLVGTGHVLPRVQTWQSSGLLLHIEVFDDRDEFVTPIAVPTR